MVNTQLLDIVMDDPLRAAERDRCSEEQREPNGRRRRHLVTISHAAPRFQTPPVTLRMGDVPSLIVWSERDPVTSGAPARAGLGGRARSALRQPPRARSSSRRR